jgi:methanogenic corrinoid protein MtbC1
MDRSETEDRLALAIETGDEVSALEAVEALLEAGIEATLIVEVMSRSMARVGDRFQAYELFLPDIIVAADAFSQAMRRLEPVLRAQQTADCLDRGTVALGVVAGDVHDIGKEIVRILMEAAGFRVLDLGSDVATERFVEAAREADIVGLSALMGTTMPAMGEVIQGLQEAGLRDGVKVLVGGAPVSAAFAGSIGADAYAADAVEGVRIALRWMDERR